RKSKRATWLRRSVARAARRSDERNRLADLLLRAICSSQPSTPSRAALVIDKPAAISGQLGEHVVPAGGRLRDLLEDVPVLDDHAVVVKPPDVDAGHV